VPNESSELSEDDRNWEQEYISMSECQKILTLAPFKLSPQQAKIFSRYLVEDVE